MSEEIVKLKELHLLGYAKLLEEIKARIRWDFHLRTLFALIKVDNFEDSKMALGCKPCENA